MSYTEDDARELLNEIYGFINLPISEYLDKDGINNMKNNILQSIRKKLKLTRTYKTIALIDSKIHDNIEVQEEHFVESHNNPHKGIRIIFGDIQSEQEELYNIKLLPAEEIRVLQEVFKSFLKPCDHLKLEQWKRVNIGLDESGEFHWIHHICPCGILQRVEQKFT